MSIVCEKQVLIQGAGVVTVPIEFRSAFQAVRFIKEDSGRIILEPLTLVDANERWFHEKAWQKGEKAAVSDFKKGNMTRVKSAKALISQLES